MNSRFESSGQSEIKNAHVAIEVKANIFTLEVTKEDPILVKEKERLGEIDADAIDPFRLGLARKMKLFLSGMIVTVVTVARASTKEGPSRTRCFDILSTSLKTSNSIP